MKHFKMGRSNSRISDCLMLLDTGGNDSRILSVSRLKNGNIYLTEECDGYYSETYTKEQFIEILDELKAWAAQIQKDIVVEVSSTRKEVEDFSVGRYCQKLAHQDTKNVLGFLLTQYVDNDPQKTKKLANLFDKGVEVGLK